MISYRVGFSECVHERASRGRHVRKRLFNRSPPPCQEQNSHQFDAVARRTGGRKRAVFRPSPRRAAACPRRTRSDWPARSPACSDVRFRVWPPICGVEHDVGQRRQCVRRVRFLGVDVEAGAGDRLVGERFDQRLLVDHRAAGDVDDIAVLAEPLEDIGVDDMMGVVRRRAPRSSGRCTSRRALRGSGNIDRARRACCG